MLYGKHFKSMYTGSMYGAGITVFAVWGYCISNADYTDGTVELNPQMLAGMLGGDVESVEQAIKFLCSPDPKSRSKDCDGIRIVQEGEFQYRLINHGTYRKMRSDDERKEYNRNKKREERDRKKAAKESNGVKPSVNDSQ